MRQAFDHLFEKLAPDDEVRRSKYWTEKSGERKLAIRRAERIAYAAASHVKDPTRAETPVAASRQMLDLYQELNQAHTRAALSKERARHALTAMKALLEDWAVAVASE